MCRYTGYNDHCLELLNTRPMSSETRETVSDLRQYSWSNCGKGLSSDFAKIERDFFLLLFPPRDLEDVPLKPGRDVAKTEIESVLACAVLRHTFVHRFPLFKRLYSKENKTTKSPEFEN